MVISFKNWSEQLNFSLRGSVPRSLHIRMIELNGIFHINNININTIMHVSNRFAGVKSTLSGLLWRCKNPLT